MRSKLKYLLFLVFITFQAFSQRAQLNPQLWREVLKKPVSERSVSLLVQGDPGVIKEQTKLLGGTFKYSVGDIASVVVPLDKVLILAQVESIKKIEGLYGQGHLLDDKQLINSNANLVHEGISPLAQGYDGTGVVMAFLDDGLDLYHPDFQNEDGTTRVAHIWDQAALTGGITPQPFNYGQEWDASVINSGNCPYYETTTQYGHGSNVAGIGAGNGLAIHNHSGIAPKSDIIAVAILFNENFLINVADATEYSFSKATAMGKPCVINGSLGTYIGSHDGYDLAAQLIDALITQQSGRSFVAAVGNEGHVPFHLGYEANNDSLFTWFTSSGKVSFEWWIDKNEAQTFEFAIGADEHDPFVFQGRTKYYNLVNDFIYVNGVDSLHDTLYNNAVEIGVITIYAYEYDSTYSCFIVIDPDLITFYWRFITNGKGRFDCWSSASLTGTSEMISAGLPPQGTFPDIARYKKPDTKQTLVSSFTCSDKVIAVGAFTNRNEFLDYYGTVQSFSDDVGELAVFSSFGPTRDGRTKPDVAAAGNLVLCTGQLITLYGMIIYQPYKVALGGFHNRNSGTSMASPVVAGVAALYLQKNPQANWKEIKDAIQVTAMKDDYTGINLPDNAWGHGKVDAFAALTVTLNYGCTDPFSINFNPLANADDGSCMPIIFGCTDTNALNFNSGANMNDGTCEYGVGVQNVPGKNLFTCYPNPSTSFTTFFFTEGTLHSNGRIVITDMHGRVADEINLDSRGGHFTYMNILPKGVYFCRLQNPDELTQTIKLIIQ